MGNVTDEPLAWSVKNVDPRHGGDDRLFELEAEHGDLPHTATVITGSEGKHFYFRLPEHQEIRNSVDAIGPGLGVRGIGGYVIAPPSIHPSGNKYYWELSSRIDQVPFAVAPCWLLGLLRSTHPESMRAQPAQTFRHQTCLDFAEIAAGIPSGKRDYQLFRLACCLRRRGYTREQTTRLILDAASRCHPPFPVTEAVQKVASAWRY